MRRMMFVSILIATLGGIELRAEFDIRAASLDAVVGWQRMDSPDGNRSVWVAPTASLTSADIAQAQPQTDRDGHVGVSIVLTDAGSVKMRDLSSAQIGKPIAMVLDGKLLFAPVVRGPIGNLALVTAGENGLSPDEVRRIIAGVSQRR